MVRRAAQRAVFLLVWVASLGLAEEAAQNTEDSETCCEQFTPRGSAAGIFQCGDCCACCDDLRVYRSEILGRLWVRGEYLAWSMRGQYFPMLLNSGPLGTPIDWVGMPPLPQTMTLVGDERLLDGLRSGGRVTGGWWWTPEQYSGVEGSFFELDADSHHHYAGIQTEGIARPYRTSTGQWQTRLISYPDVQNGSIDISAETQFTGGEALLRQVVSFGESYRIDLVAGYRHAHLGDQLMITESTETVSGVETELFDLFRTENDFHGGQVGAIARWRRNNLSLQLLGKLALGETVTHTEIDGGTATLQGSQYSGSAGGLLAQPSNMGQYRNTGFATFEELGLNLELQLTCTARAFLGYSLLGWSRVARVADQVNLDVNSPLELKTTSFWAQGMNVGLEYQF